MLVSDLHVCVCLMEQLLLQVSYGVCVRADEPLPVGTEEGWSTKGEVDSEVRTAAAITSLSA